MNAPLSGPQQAAYHGLREAVSAVVRDAAKWLGTGVITVLGLVFGTEEGRDGVVRSLPPPPSRPPEAMVVVEHLNNSAILAAAGSVVAGTLAGIVVGFWLCAANIAIVPRECGRGRWLVRVWLLLGLGFSVAAPVFLVTSRTSIRAATLFGPVVNDQVLWPMVIGAVINLLAYALAFAGGFALTAPKALRIACAPAPLCHLYRAFT
jgi:hypothetical protein